VTLVPTTSFAQVLHRYRGGPVVTDKISEGNQHTMKIPRCIALVMLSCFLFMPDKVLAQASTGNIAGTVKDSSGAVLPGVTVEAASPALIEKVRSVVTDEQGEYRIVELRPGTYTVTFTLPGFVVIRREGIELTSSFTAARMLPARFTVLMAAM